MKIHQLAFFKDLTIEEELINSNANIISIIAASFIKIIDPKDYKKDNLYTYQRFIGKLIYFSYGLRPDIIFVIRQLNKYNSEQRKDYLWAVKKVLGYLKKTIEISLTFDRKLT